MYLIYLIVFIITLGRPIEILPDSESYLNMSINRSPVYPLFLTIIKALFGDFFHTFTIFFQTLACVLSVNYLLKCLKKSLILNSLWLVLLAIVLLTPCVYSLNISNRLLTEAISYSLYLLIVANLIVALKNEDIKYIAYSCLPLFLLILCRNQFIYLIPIFLIITIWMSLKLKNFKKNAPLIILITILPILTINTDKLYHKIKHGHFVSTPWTGIHLISPAFYVADENDAHIFKDKNERYFFNEVYKKLKEEKLNINHIEPKHSKINYFIDNYSYIANFTLHDFGIQLMGKNLDENEKLIALDSMTKKMSKPLIINNFSKWLKIYIGNFINAFGGIANAIIILILLFFGLLKLKSNLSNIKLITLGSILIISNAAVVSIGVHTIERLVFYNNWIIFLIVFLLLEKLSNYYTSKS